MLKPVRIYAPLDSVIPLDEAKRHCRVDDEQTIDDDLIEGLVAAATGRLEKMLEMAFVTQSWRQDYCEFSDRMILPLRDTDLESVFVYYYDANNSMQALDPSIFAALADEREAYVALQFGKSWPSTYDRPDAISVYFDAGVEVEDVPSEIKLAVKLLVGAWYENREQTVIGVTVSELPVSVSVRALVSSYIPMRV